MIKVRDGYGKLIGSDYNGNIAHVLLSNGGNLQYAVGSTASTLVQRNASGQIESSVASTVAPFVISSTKVNANLNADLLDGFQATGLFQSLTSAADKNLYIKIGDTEKEVPLLYASYLGGITKEGLFTELTNVNDSTNPNSIKVTIGDTTKYLKVAYSDLAGKVVCSSSTNNIDRPIVVTNTSNGVYYSTKVTLNYSTGNVTAPTFTGALIGNADTATTASKLSTVSKTAWGQTYWTSDGVPTSISGDMIGVGNITFNKEKAFNIVNGGSFLPTSNTDDYWWGVHRYDTNVAIAVMPASGIFQTRFETHLAFGSGNVGIGNTSPQQKLDVSGKIKADALYLTRSGGSVAFSIAEEAGTNGYNIIASGGSSFIRFYTNNTTTAEERMRLDSNGNLGIGTPTPGHKLHVVGNTWAAGFIKQDSSDNYVLLGGGGHKLLSELGISGGPYLPLSGGVLSGHLALGTPATTAQLLLSIERNNNKLSMLISGANEGWLLNNFSSGKSTALIQNETRGLLFKDTYDNYFNVWHAGNDGSGSGLDADLLDGKHDGEVTAQYFSPGKLLTSSDTINKLMSGIYCYINGDNPTGSVDDNVVLLSFRNTGRTDMIQFVGAANTSNLYYRRAANIGNQYENWTSWKTIAFTDSNVASATKLQNAVTIWGQLFDGSSDITGDLLLGAYRILGKDAVDIVNAGSNHLVLGYGSSAKGWPTYVDGDSIYLRYGTSHSDGIFVNSSGNVGIGTTAPIHKLQVAGAGVFNNTGSTTFTTNGITIGAGDAASRYITCYGKTGSSYINVGYGPGINNSGEFFFNYVSSGSTSNYSGVGIYGGANYMYLYPDYATFRKPLIMPGELYSGDYAINMSNSDIVGINALYTADNAESGAEGLQFSRGNGYYDSIWASSGTLYFSPNGNLNRAGGYSTNYTVIHSGNIGSQSVNYATSAGNADTVDSLHASDFVRAYGTYGTSYSYDSDWGQSIVTFDPIVSGTAPAQNPNISILNIGNNYARRKQLAFTYSTNDIYYRRHTDSSWSGWVRLAIAGESYTKSESDSRFINASGDTMTGTLYIGDSKHYLQYYTGGKYVELYNVTAATGIGVWDTGEAKVFNSNGQYKIWHEGNDGSGSGLDADTVDGVHASSLSQIKYIGNTSDFCYDVILLCKRDVAHSARLDGLLFTTGGGVCRYHCADAHFWHSCWSVGSYDTQKSISNKGYDGYGFEFCTCTYGGAVWYAIKLNRIQAVSYFFMGDWDNINWTLITYYHTSQGVKNSEIYNSISNLTSTPLRYSGSIYAHHFYESSDSLLKTNIVDINSSDNIPQLKEFDWKEDGSHSYGLIAQELEEQGYSELVSTKNDGYKTVNYSAALSLIVGKLQVKIKELEKEIEILKNKN